MLQLGQSKINPQAVVEGVWTTFIVKKADGTEAMIELRLALANTEINKQYRAAVRAAMEPHERILALVSSGKSKRVPEEVTSAINDAGRDCFLKNIVTDWKGIDAPFSVDGMKQLLEEFPELFGAIEEEAARVERFRIAVQEIQAGN